MSDAETQQSTLPDPTAEGTNIQHTVPERAEVATMASVAGPPPRRGPGRPPKSAAEPVMSAGELAAKRVVAEAEARRGGVAEKPLSPEELKEDWQEALVAKDAKPASPPELAGLYRVMHGELHFGGDKIAMLGTKIRLSAQDAHMFLQHLCPHVRDAQGNIVGGGGPVIKWLAE